jgi:hypothetical protein
MNVQFNTLFSINLKHSYYASGLCADFDIVPTAECQANMRRFGLGAKLVGGVLLVYFEQTPATIGPRLKMEDWTPFRFMLQLRQSAFYNYTMLPNSRKPFFFSNLDDNGAEKPQNTEGSFLSKNTTPDATDLMDIKSNAFTVNHPLGTTQIKLSIMRPLTGFQLAKTIDTRPLAPSTPVNLPNFQNGLIKIESDNSPTPQYVFSDVLAAANRPFGIIEIWKGAATDYTQTQRFMLNWTRKMDFWRYFILKNKVPPSPNPVVPVPYTIDIENIKAVEYPKTARFDLVCEADFTAAERLTISNYTDADVDLFRSSVALPQFERPLGKIRLSHAQGRIDMLLPQPTFRSADTNIIVKIQKS